MKAQNQTIEVVNKSYTVYEVDSQANRIGKEHLDNIEEVNEWLQRRKPAHAVIIRDKTGGMRHALLKSDEKGDYYDIGV